MAFYLLNGQIKSFRLASMFFCLKKNVTLSFSLIQVKLIKNFYILYCTVFLSDFNNNYNYISYVVWFFYFFTLYQMVIVSPSTNSYNLQFSLQIYKILIREMYLFLLYIYIYTKKKFEYLFAIFLQWAYIIIQYNVCL